MKKVTMHRKVTMRREKSRFADEIGECYEKLSSVVVYSDATQLDVELS